MSVWAHLVSLSGLAETLLELWLPDFAYVEKASSQQQSGAGDQLSHGVCLCPAALPVLASAASLLKVPCVITLLQQVSEAPAMPSRGHPEVTASETSEDLPL